ncbi:hypothetical protein B0J12DRAFT_395573 [Macrophomina phaseolina]|uniref:Uncharacterized protein n=1 Tax=Macrophomina phaseolina TaxID=35725 RepID=A0ABQ8FS56_9PEZI|nr:hypothetical protein B0J12DRAFT_395573 [Macrophomina phaseolina]
MAAISGIMPAVLENHRVFPAAYCSGVSSSSPRFTASGAWWGRTGSLALCMPRVMGALVCEAICCLAEVGNARVQGRVGHCLCTSTRPPWLQHGRPSKIVCLRQFETAQRADLALQRSEVARNASAHSSKEGIITCRAWLALTYVSSFPVLDGAASPARPPSSSKTPSPPFFFCRCGISYSREGLNVANSDLTDLAAVKGSRGRKMEVVQEYLCTYDVSSFSRTPRTSGLSVRASSRIPPCQVMGLLGNERTGVSVFAHVHDYNTFSARRQR